MTFLIRVFVPSWQFFDRSGPQPGILIHTNGRWEPAFEAPAIRWYALLFNPAVNAHHAFTNLLERLLIEAETSRDIRSLVSYRLVESKVREQLGPSQGEFRFKITSRGEDVLLCSSGST